MLLSLHVADRITTLALELQPHSPHVGVEPGGHTPAGKTEDSGIKDTYVDSHRFTQKVMQSMHLAAKDRETKTTGQQPGMRQVP